MKNFDKKKLNIQSRIGKALFISITAELKKEYIIVELLRRDKALKKYRNLKRVIEYLIVFKAFYEIIN